MKTIYLIMVAFSFTLLGCGGNNDSKPIQDGKGDIDFLVPTVLSGNVP